MGNWFSYFGNKNRNSAYNINDSLVMSKGNKCIICYEKVDKQYAVRCTKCFIKMHEYCYTNFNEIIKYNQCICPSCHKIGTLYIDIYVKSNN